MDIPISSAGLELDDLVRRAESGEQVVLTRNGQAVVTLNPVTQAKISIEERRASLRPFLGIARDDRELWPDAAHSADFLYGEDGLPK